MKTLILYATKHGAAREIARRIAKEMGGAVVHDLKQNDIPSIDQFDCVIIGSSLYAGSIRREAKAFLSQHADSLRGKRLGLFLCGMDAGREKEYFAANFSAELMQTAGATAFLGGIFDPQKAGFAERLIMKAVAKQSKYTSSIDDGKIERFAEAMKA